MKIRLFTLLMIAALFLAGCSAAQARDTLDSVEDQAEQMLDTAEDQVEKAITEMMTTATAAASQPAAAENTVPSTALTKEEAAEIALKHAGLTTDQVTNLRTEYEIDDGVPQYEVEFHQDIWEYDYEINAETGEILSYDKEK